MKKVFALAVAVVMVSALFAASFVVNASELVGFSADWYAFDGAIVKNDGHCETYVIENPQTYTKNPDVPAADVVGFLGWANLGEDKIAGFAYKLDNGAPVYDEQFFSKVFNAAFDRTAELTDAGMPNAEGYWIVFYYNNLLAGKHTATFIVKGEDGVEHTMFSYEFTVVGEGGEPVEPAETEAETTEETQAETSAETPADTSAETPDDQTDEAVGTDAGSGAEGTADAQTGDAEETKADDPGTEAAAADAETESEKSAENPKTSDAAVIAIASVVAIALAGVVIAKKIKD